MLRINGGWTILCYLSFLFALPTLKGIKYQTCDILVLFFISYSLLTYPVFGDYPFEMFVSSIRDQIFPMSFYFFARNSKTSNCDMVQHAIYPLVVAYVVGIFLFFTSPGWYIDYRLNDRSYNQSINNYFNLTRMSSFWSSSYCVGYSALYIIIYIINRNVFDNHKIKYYGIILIISFLSLFLAQQRISIGYVAFYLFVVFIILVKNRRITLGKTLIYCIVVIAVVGIIAFVANQYMDKYYIEYIMSRFDSEDGVVEDRINMFEKYISTISFFGEGFGKYSHNALFHDLPCISDCEYIRTPNEIGIFGTSIFLFLILISFINSFKKGRIFSFESFIVLFFLCAMVGATPLEVSQHQPFMLWYCVGRMQNK